jgi:transcriptional regulator with XRE-family HTH domain
MWTCQALSSTFLRKFLEGCNFMLYSRYLELCKENGIAPSTLAIQLGYSKNAYSRWKDSAEESGGIVSLRSDTLLKIADYFGVSTDYLCGRSERRSEFSPIIAELTSNPRKMLLLDEMEGMTDKSLEQVIRIMRTIKGMQDD